MLQPFIVPIVTYLNRLSNLGLPSNKKCGYPKVNYRNKTLKNTQSLKKSQKYVSKKFQKV